MNARAQASLTACLTEAVGLASVWIPRWLDQIQAELGQRDNAASHGHEKHSIGQARSVLLVHRDLLADRFLAALRQDLENVDSAPRGSSASVAPLRLKNLSFDDLELMDHDQVQQTVDLVRWQQIVKMAADDELAAFSSRLSRVQGFDVVRVDANPLRPDRVVAAWLRALDTLHLDEAVRTRWLAAGAMPLGQALAGFYRQLEEWLERHGVAPADFVVIQAPETPVTRVGTQGRDVTNVLQPSAQPGAKPVLSLDQLHQLLVGNLERSGASVSDQGASGSGNAMVRSLAGEVVTLLLRRIAEDTRLLRPVRELVQQLKEPLLQLARTDPRFFADRENPARQLLEAITARSLAFSSEQDEGFESFARHVHEAVRALQTAGAQLSDKLPDELARLNAALASRTGQAQGLAVQTLVRVEQRNVLAESVAREIEGRNDFARAPGLVRRFLVGPWAQVVAHARLSFDPSGPPPSADAPALRFMEVLPDLLWSSQLALASRNRPRLIKVIPRVLRTLREGLDSIDYPRGKSEAFFSALMGLHEAAYKTQHEVGGAGDSVWNENQDGSAAEAEPWMRHTEARDSGFMTDADELPTPGFVDTAPMPSHWEPQAVAEVPAVGAWVDLEEGGKVQRCQLTWASPHGRIFLFTTAKGRSVSLSRMGLQRMLQTGQLHVVADHGLVDDALNAVARMARDNSARG